MEKHNQALESIERRRALATILRIPPILLGLADLDHMVEIATGQEAPAPSAHTKRAKTGQDTIKRYQDILKVYNTLFNEGLTYASIQDIEKWTRRIERDVDNTPVENKNALLRVLWDFEILCSQVWASDLLLWPKTFEHLANAIEIATTLNDRDLLAVTFYTSGVYRLRQEKPGLARADTDSALIYAKGALPQTKGAIYALDAWWHRYNDTSASGALLAEKLLDEAEKYAGAESERKTIKFGKGRYLLDRAYASIQAGKPMKALELLDESERRISTKRLLVFIDILRAKCYIEKPKPEYEQATTLLKDAIGDSQSLRIGRNIDHIDKLHRKLLASTYGNAPDVVDLGLALRDLRVKKR